jgi:hypothetical protein
MTNRRISFFTCIWIIYQNKQKTPSLENGVSNIADYVYFCWGRVPGILVGAALKSRTLLDVALGIKMVEKRQSNTTAVARIQVPFSKTSVVCLTPINWLLKPATFPARPPPFGFCTNIIKPNKPHASNKIITKNIMV